MGPRLFAGAGSLKVWLTDGGEHMSRVRVYKLMRHAKFIGGDAGRRTVNYGWDDIALPAAAGAGVLWTTTLEGVTVAAAG